MAKKRKKIPDFFSFEIGEVRGIAASMKDDKVWGQWSRKALDDLSIGCILDDTDPRVRKMYEESKAIMEENYNRKKEWYENKKASRNELTADGDTREGSLDEKSGTSADNCGPRQAKTGDASHREAEDESANVSKNMRRVPQNEAPAHGFSGGRTAQGTMSRSPEAAAQSGKAYDQETIGISTNKRRTGGPPLSQTSSLPPVRQSEPDVMSLAYSGEFQNVRLTQAQYAQLGIKFGNQQKLNRAIDSLSCQIENGEKNPANHYAELVKWANYREDMDERKEEEASKPKMTEMEKSWIAAMKRVEAM